METYKLIREAIHSLGKAGRKEIIDYISNNNDVNPNTISTFINGCTVNSTSRINMPYNKKPRGFDQRYDVLFKVDKNSYIEYSKEEHGTWLIVEDNGILRVIQDIDDEESDDLDSLKGFAFPVEEHLKAFLSRNLESIVFGNNIYRLYVDENGIEGIEFDTGNVGRIDILAIDANNNFVVFELKQSGDSDKVIGQISKYMGWVKENLASSDQKVFGIIVTQNISDKLKYASTMINGLSLFQYEMDFKINPVMLNN